MSSGQKSSSISSAFVYSLKHSIPILISFIPVGLAYGIYMHSEGFAWYWSGFCSLTVFAGSLQFVMVDFFKSGISLLSVAGTALFVNSRHIFYGIPFMKEWKDYGIYKYFLIYALPDEAFSLHCSNHFDDGDPAHRKLTYVFDAALVLLYWVVLSTLGGLAGTLLSFSTEGIDFALTALFIVIVLEQLRAIRGSFLPPILAAVTGILCLLVLGPDSFILPALLITAAVLLVFRPVNEKNREERKC